MRSGTLRSTSLTVHRTFPFNGLIEYTVIIIAVFVRLNFTT
jgi:hypothetical protein